MMLAHKPWAASSKGNTFKTIETLPAKVLEWLCGIEPYTEHIVWVSNKCCIGQISLETDFMSNSEANYR